MLRSFVGAFAAGGAEPDASRLTAAIAPEGPSQLLLLGSLAIAYTGPPLRSTAPGRPLCVLDGTLYEARGLALPARSGPELEAFLADAYRTHGAALLTRLRGDFALVLFDPERGGGLLARDQLGGRGAVWHERDGQLLFATEYRPLIAALARRPEPDRAAVAHWLAASGMPGDRSLYAGVRRVEAGCALPLVRGGAAPQRYWSPAPRELDGAEPAEHVAALRNELQRAVRRRIEPGESAAVLLSGGLDSGAVAALAAESRGKQSGPPAYSAIFPEHPSVDESELIESLTAELGMPATTIRVRGGSVLEGALTYLRRFDMPAVSPNLFFWTPLLRRARADGVAVLLDGEGGDELFGCSRYLLADRLMRGRALSALDLIRRMPGMEGRATRRALAFYLPRYALKGAAPYRLHSAARRVRGLHRYGPDWMRPEAARDFIESDDSHAWKLAPGPRWLGDLVYRVTRGMGPALAYDHIRRRAALAGVEPRHPLIDVDVVELVLGLPPELAFDGHRSRPLLRAAVEGLLPDPVRMRPTKSNFDAVFHEALTGVDLPAVRNLLGRPGAEVGAWVERAKLDELLAAPPQKERARMWWALHVWRLVTAECWLLAQGGPEAVEAALGRPLAEPWIELSPRAGVRVAG